MTHEPFATSAHPDIQQIYTLIAELVSERPLVQRLAARVVGGAETARPRALLTVLCARLGQPDLQNVYHAAAAIELTYSATEVHHTLIDETARRLGISIREAGSNGNVGLMIGDYLFALAASEMARVPDPRIIAAFSEAVMRFTEGQLHPVSDLTPYSAATAAYRQYSADRSGSLFEAAACAGAVCGQLTPVAIAQLTRFGAEIGIAAHLLHDARTYQNARAETHPRRIGITQTLIEVAEAGYADQLAPLLSRKALEPAAFQQVLDLVAQTNAIQRTLEHAVQHRDQALAQLNSWEDSAMIANLVSYAHTLVPTLNRIG